jgi:hypothetical protein
MASVETLTELLRKISKSTDHVKVEANYDGREWHWKTTEINVTASEWTPKVSKLDRKFPPRERAG